MLWTNNINKWAVRVIYLYNTWASLPLNLSANKSAKLEKKILDGFWLHKDKDVDTMDTRICLIGISHN